MPKISVIIPARNEAESIGEILKKIKSVLKQDYEIIVIDDGSTDNTAQIAKDNQARVIKHPYNIGNGAAVKTGIRNSTGQILLLMDADGQHNPEYIPELIKPVEEEYDMAVGARRGWKNIPVHRKLANIFYNAFASYLVKRRVQDLTCGFRAVKAKVAKKFIYLLPNTFSYPSTLIMSLSRAGHSITYVPIELEPSLTKSKISLLADGVRFIMIITKIGVFFNPLRIFIPTSLLCFSIGFAHAVYKIIIRGEQYTGFTLLFITTSVIIFLMGLIAEQIAQLRLEESEDRP